MKKSGKNGQLLQKCRHCHIKPEELSWFCLNMSLLLEAETETIWAIDLCLFIEQTISITLHMWKSTENPSLCHLRFICWIFRCESYFNTSFSHFSFNFFQSQPANTIHSKHTLRQSHSHEFTLKVEIFSTHPTPRICVL